MALATRYGHSYFSIFDISVYILIILKRLSLDSSEQKLTWPDTTGILKDIEITQENAWIVTNVSGIDLSQNVFFALFGEDGKPLVQDGQIIRKDNNKDLKIPSKIL